MPNIYICFLSLFPEFVEKKSPQKSTQQTPNKTQPPKAQTQVPVKNISTASEKVKEFRLALRSNDIDKALGLKSRMTAEDKLTITDKSTLIESLVRSDRLTEAKTLILDMIERESTFPLPRIFRFYLNKTATAGDTQSLEQIGEKLTPELKRTLSFDNRYCHASIASGKGEKYLEKLEQDLTNAKTPEQIKIVSEQFPRGGAIGILEKHPEFCERFETLAENYAKEQIMAPMNILWVHHFCSGNDSKAEEIFQKYLHNEPRLMFQKVMTQAREQNDLNMTKKLIEKLKISKITEGALGNAYSCLIDILAAKKQLEEAIVVIEEAKRDVGLEFVNRTALFRIKDGLLELKKDVPFVIPERSKAREGPETSSSSSSSSSDDEVTQRK